MFVDTLNEHYSTFSRQMENPYESWRKFTYEGKLREVYTEDGHPRPPQVCIDFLTDVWERASGTWYQGATKPADGGRLEAHPKKTEGVIDFDKLEVGNRRSVASFTDFTVEHPEYFDVWEIPLDKRIAFRERDAFFAYLAEQADMFIEGPERGFGSALGRTSWPRAVRDAGLHTATISPFAAAHSSASANLSSRVR